MTFTDDDLKRWANCIWQEPGNVRDLSVKEFKALLSRLEAAELALGMFVKLEREDASYDDTVSCLNLWRKAAGKDKAGGFIPDQTGEQPSKRIKYE